MGSEQLFEASWECPICHARSRKWTKTWRATRYASIHMSRSHDGTKETPIIRKRKVKNGETEGDLRKAY